MASRGMSLKKKKKKPVPQAPCRLQVQTSSCYKWLQLWASAGRGQKTRNKTNTQNARLALRAGFNTVYIAPVMVWKCSQPQDTGIHFGYIICSDKRPRQNSPEVKKSKNRQDLPPLLELSTALHCTNIHDRDFLPLVFFLFLFFFTVRYTQKITNIFVIFS